MPLRLYVCVHCSDVCVRHVFIHQKLILNGTFLSCFAAKLLPFGNDTKVKLCDGLLNYDAR